MNQNRRPMDKKSRKEMKKEIKKGQEALFKKKDLRRTDTLTPKKALKKYPSKIQKVEQALMDATVKGMQIKKKKGAAKSSKRTAPGQVHHRESPPAYEHREGKRWEKTLVAQNQAKKKSLTSKLQKRKGIK